jgi:hypothetical protein
MKNWNRVCYEGESNENRKTEIKIRNIAPLSYNLADMLPMLYRVSYRWQYNADKQNAITVPV